MTNRVFLNQEGIIEVHYEGDQTYASVQKVTQKVTALAEELRETGKKVVVINSLEKLGTSSSGSRSASAEALDLLVYDRIALYGANLFFKYLANFIIAASGKAQKVRHFDTREEAMKWLKKQA